MVDDGEDARHAFAMDLASYVSISASFSICRDLHLWPPYETASAFLSCGVDDLVGGGVIEWDALDVPPPEYAAAVARVDPEHAFDTLEQRPGDWKNWFAEAVRRLQDGGD